MYIIEIKLAPGDHESNFKRVGEIPCGCNTKCTELPFSLINKSNNLSIYHRSNQ